MVFAQAVFDKQDMQIIIIYETLNDADFVLALCIDSFCVFQNHAISN